MITKKRSLAAMFATATLVLAGCGASNTSTDSDSGSGGSGDSGDSEWADCDMHEGVAPMADAGEDADKEISIAAFNGWDESFATAHLLKAVLEQNGYTVDIQALEAAPAYTAVAQGDIDLLTDGWLPITHKKYIDDYGDDLESLGCWYDNAKLTIAVNDDSPAKTIADLKDMADEYDNTIYGIEPGAGLTAQVQDEAIPTYGLESMNFTISSTPAMLAAIKKSQQDGTNVAVTLWRPHWAYAAFPMRDLEDPEGAMGGKEFVYSFATDGFSEEHPQAAQLVKNLVLSDENLASLENIMFGEDNYAGSDNDAAVAQWLSENPDFADQLMNAEL